MVIEILGEKNERLLIRQVCEKSRATETLFTEAWFLKAMLPRR
jgi:hypothetical protein